MIDADFAELIDDDGDPPAMVGGENAVEQSRFPRSEEAGEDGNGNSLIVFCHALEIFRRLFSKGNNRALSSQRYAVGLFHRKM